jgi:hypothetical protein
MNKEAELESVQVQRKAEAARSWCKAASAIGSKPWKYILLSHTDIRPTDSFEGVLAKAYAFASAEKAGVHDGL